LQVQFWLPDAPYQKRPKVSTHPDRGGRTVDIHGNPLEPVYPPEYFADMAGHHKKAFLQELSSHSGCHHGAGHWRLLDALPCLDAEHFGQELPQWKYKDLYGADPLHFFKCLFKIHDGELLGVETEWQYGLSPEALNRECIHVQYARNQPQQKLMMRMHLPGTQASLRVTNQPPAMLTWEEYRNIGNTLVTRVEPPAHKKGKVVTWPQLFHLGAMQGYTAMEIFACGCHMELMLSARDRAKHGGYGHD
jgi:hypothetical protein